MIDWNAQFDKLKNQFDEEIEEQEKELSFYLHKLGYGKDYYELQKRINKAIEYIENSDKYDFSKCELLDILKGSDTNE